MTTANVTAVQAQVLYKSGDIKSNVTSLQAEVLYNSNEIKANVASFGLQTFITIPYERFQGISSEVLYIPSPNVSFQGIVAEVLLKILADDPKPGKMAIVKQMSISKQLSIKS